MKNVSKTLLVISELRKEIAEVRAEVRKGLSELRDELVDRIDDSEHRTATAINGLAETMHEVLTVLRAQNDVRPRLERCEADIAAIKVKLPAND
jgi:hypothetical protein